MPKPIFGVNGSGMHTHQSLLTSEGREERLLRPEGPVPALEVALGTTSAASSSTPRRSSAVTNPLVNSYKRLVPGYEAPINVAWSEKNRSPLVRSRPGAACRRAARCGCPTRPATPTSALAVMLAAGLDGIGTGSTPGSR
jgi:glutamine synthetase